jgi:hypothetical protein
MNREENIMGHLNILFHKSEDLLTSDTLIINNFK